jgi:AP-2 complex subunit sigma-1
LTHRLWQWRNYKLVYRRYAGLFFTVCVDTVDNELAFLEMIHLFVEVRGRILSPVEQPADPLRSRLVGRCWTDISATCASSTLWCCPPPKSSHSTALSDHMLAPPQYNFHKVYMILDEFFLAGEIQESSKKVIMDRLRAIDKLADD